MGQEIYTQQVRFKRFLGLNTKISDTAIDIREAAGLQNVNLTEETLEVRKGQTTLSTNRFQTKALVDTPMTGIYSGVLNGTEKFVGTGGDAFREQSGGAWVDRTGAVVINPSQNDHYTFTNFLDGAVAEVFIMANGVNPPFKWTGAGNATPLLTPPGNFKFQVVHKNKLWVTIGDILYFSGLRNAESWDTVNDLVRFEGDGEDITGLAVYSDNIIVSKPSGIWAISGSDNRTLFSKQIVNGEGFAAGYSIQQINSSRYGNILVGLTKDGLLKGFNGTKNLIKLGEPAESLFKSMNLDRLDEAVSVVYPNLNQYWVSMSFGSGADNNQLIGYDYFNDSFSNDKGRPLSTILYHVGINANAMYYGPLNGVNYWMTSDYDGELLRQDNGNQDPGGTAIEGEYLTGKIAFGDPSIHKLLTDLNIVLTMKTVVNLKVSVATSQTSGEANVVITPIGSRWGFFLWGTGLWSAPTIRYHRLQLTPTPSGTEGSVSGRYFQFFIEHSTVDQQVKIEDFMVGISNLGQEAEYVET